MGLVNQLEIFSHHIVKVGQPPRDTGSVQPHSRDEGLPSREAGFLELLPLDSSVPSAHCQGTGAAQAGVC